MASEEHRTVSLYALLMLAALFLPGIYSIGVLQLWLYEEQQSAFDCGCSFNQCQGVCPCLCRWW